MSGYGPNCPQCGKSAEWTQSEIDEIVYAPKTYCCNHCFQFYVLGIEEMVVQQQQAQASQAEWDTAKVETEEDWKKAREQWEKGA